MLYIIIEIIGYHVLEPPSLARSSHIPFDPYFNFSNSPKSTTLNSLLAHITTLNTKPGKNPPPTPIPSLQLRPCHSSRIASKTHITPFAGTTYFANKSATSSDTHGTGLRSCVIASLLLVFVFVFNPYPPPPLFFPAFNSSVLMIPTLTGGSGKKYSAYALARKLAIASKVGMKLDMLARSGMWKSAGARGRMVRRRVYVRVEDVSRAERVEMRWDWSGRYVSCEIWDRNHGICTLLIHALFDGVFVVGLGGVLECAAEAGCCHLS